MQSLVALDGTSDPVRIVPFNPLANPAAMAKKRDDILAQLSQERRKTTPNAWLVKAYETWLRVHSRYATALGGGLTPRSTVSMIAE
jgi:hypothetical protein